MYFCTLQADEENFEFFAVYCGLALHHAKLYDKIRRSEQKYKVSRLPDSTSVLFTATPRALWCECVGRVWCDVRV